MSRTFFPDRIIPDEIYKELATSVDRIFQKLEIYKKLRIFWNKAEKLGLNIYAIGLKGSQNYNLDEEDSDFDANLVFIPSLNQIRTNKVYNIKTEFGECVCHNIYSFAKIVAKGNPQWIEVCNTPYKIGNFDIFKKYKLNPTALKGYMEKLFRNMKDDCFYIPAKECIMYGLADKFL